MATFTLLNSAKLKLFKGGFDFSTHTFKGMLTSTAPASTASTKSDITEIAAGNGYTAGGFAIGVTVALSGSTVRVAGTDVVLAASGGSIGPYRYLVVYDDTTANDDLVGYVDNGSTITQPDGQSVTFDFTDANATMLTA